MIYILLISKLKIIKKNDNIRAEKGISLICTTDGSENALIVKSLLETSILVSLSCLYIVIELFIEPPIEILDSLVIKFLKSGKFVGSTIKEFHLLVRVSRTYNWLYWPPATM
jgi:hypothetical protein